MSGVIANGQKGMLCRCSEHVLPEEIQLWYHVRLELGHWNRKHLGADTR